MTAHARPWLPVAALVLAMLSFQFGASVASTLFAAVGATGTTALRLGLSALILCGLTRAWRGPIAAPLRLPLLGFGLVMGVMNLSFYAALRTIPLGIAVALEFLGPLLLTIALSRRATDLAWAVLAAAGVALLLPIHAHAGRLDPAGVAYALCAGACWAAYILLSARIGPSLGTRAAALGMLVGAILVVPLGIAHAGAALLHPAVLLVGLAVGVLCGALPYSLEMFALSHLPPRVYGTLTSVEPALGALVGGTIMGQSLNRAQWLAIALVTIAAAGATLTASRADDRANV